LRDERPSAKGGFVMRKALIYVSIAIFLGALGMSWLTHGTGVVRNDSARNIYVPTELTIPLQVKAAYNGRNMFFRYRWRQSSHRSITT
jgi:hypothetical protein